MGQLDKLANSLFGGKRAETQAGFAEDKTATLIGTAIADSDSGAVMVELSSDVTNPEPIEIDGETYFADADTAVELPTTQDVQAGDEVLVSVFGGSALKNSVVTGVVGSGDRVAGVAADAADAADAATTAAGEATTAAAAATTAAGEATTAAAAASSAAAAADTKADAAQSTANAAQTTAQNALDVANATGQHFWHDTDGAHVTEVTQEDWNDSTSANFHSGPNSLINSLGMLIRNGLTNLMAVLSSGIAIYDGSGNAASNVIASFTSSGAQIGYASDYHTVVDTDGLSVYAPGAIDPSMSVSSFGMGIEGANGAVTFNVNNSWGVPRIYSGAGLQMMNGFYQQMGTFYPLAGFTVEPYGDNTSTIAGEYLHLLHFDESSRAVTEGTFAMGDVIAALQKIERIGTAYENSRSVAITAANIDSHVEGPSITLPAGSYFIVGTWTFNTGTTSGTRNNNVYIRVNGAAYNEGSRVFAAAQNFGKLQAVAAFRLTNSSNTVTLMGSSSRPSAAANCYIQAICIG